MSIVVKKPIDGSFRLVDSTTSANVMVAEADSKLISTKVGSVARTDTAAKNLFRLPANAVPIAIRIWSAVLSDAVTTATVSVGKTGSTSFFVSAFDVKGGTLKAQNDPVASNLFVSVGTSPIQVVGIFATTGGAGTTGGPFFVAMDYYLA